MAVATGEIVRGIFFWGMFGTAAGWVIFKTVQKADDPARMVFKWVLTALILGIMFWVVAPIVGQGGYSAGFAGIPATAVCGLALTIIWRHNLGALIAQPFADLYTGGSTPPDPHPAYSVAQARQKQGRYLDAVAEIRKQLERFPTDVEGQLLLAQIQAEDLNDLPAAELTIQHFCEQPGHAPQNIAFALYSMADWYLALRRDREAARRHLERIIELLPDSEVALGAAQRIAHLGTMEMLLAPEDRKKFIVTEGVKHLGLVKNHPSFRPAEKDPGQQAAEYVKHLEEHPYDTEAREQLAVIYVDYYGRLDLATDQFEQMIAQPNQPGRLVVHWLNLLADLQIRSGVDYETVRQTLQRIIDRDPSLASAEIARNRLALLKLELKAKEKSQAVKLGSYEQNIGLKERLPRG
jgi:tetratricopeptide (TPR) repeat protein